MSTKLTALLHLVDSTLPIGSFNHSAGLETFVQEGVVNTSSCLKKYVETQLAQNWTYNDGAYVSIAYDAVKVGDIAALELLDKTIAAAKTPREIREASIKLGVRLLKIFARYEQHKLVNAFQSALMTKRVQGFYPLVFGLIASAMGQSKEDTLTAFYYNTAVGTITNGVKLIPLSQADGQDILFELRDAIDMAVAESMQPDAEWIGAASPAADIRAMRHERLYSRLYMS
ncbi:urease accessory protein UreF [Neisseria arctica]|uniref:Urease accessory protein UreF n=1 Tax=Neisseria arctica TaxID=1470200 RepID=A0A0J1C5P5_9NEIS|nr:urease accessory protein UreF [Neisseria arctica]KLT73673.1 urease accessory protein UreF [Neisseria arctica]UOO85806.1 urease accessory protein UreF [Neisseria arctica]